MSYQEGKDSTFTHNGVEYPLDPFIQRAAKQRVVQLRVKDIKWNLDGMNLDAERVRRADPSVPILFTVDPDYGYVIIDGTHRLAKAVQQGKYSISFLKLSVLPVALWSCCTHVQTTMPVTVGIGFPAGNKG